VRGDYERSSGRELTGLIIILIGFGLLMNSMGILPYGPYIARFWLPAALIGGGVFLLSRGRGNDGRLGGAFFVLLGFLFFIARLNYWDISLGKMIWPAILMWIGISMLLRRSRPRGMRTQRETFGLDQTMDSSDYLQATAILGGFNRKSSSQQFRGGDFTAIMGGGKIDLREAQMQGNEAVIDVFTVMGGMEIQVPMDWGVEQGFVPILGGYDDKTRKTAGASKRLILHGTTIMGGVSVTN
jgi:predicted membrane protein